MIAITKPVKKDNWAYAAVAAAVRLVGGEPVALTSLRKGDRVRAQGLIFGGGQDIFPMLYDETPKQGFIYDRERDALEIAAAEQATKDDIPSLGICRGAQMMNVVRGGALHADVSIDYDDAVYPNGLWGKAFFRKCISIEPNSQLRDIIGDDTADVNSLHKQAIKRVGENLRPTAKEPNGVIQAIEDDRLSFFMGVQFHPELLIYRNDIRRLFQRLIDMAGRRDAIAITG